MIEQPPAALMAEITSDFDKLRGMRRRRLVLFGGVVVAALVGFGLGQTTPPLAAEVRYWLSLGAVAFVGLLSCALAFGWRLPARSRLWAWPWVGLATTAAALGLIIQPGPGEPFLQGIWCFATGAGVLLAVLLLALVIGGRGLRRHAPTGLLLGLGAGLLGLIPLHLACPHGDVPHLLWHAFVPLAGGLLGALGHRLASERA